MDLLAAVMAQPIVPVLLYFYDWRWILLGLFLATLLWRMTVLQWFVSVRKSGWSSNLG